MARNGHQRALNQLHKCFLYILSVALYINLPSGQQSQRQYIMCKNHTTVQGLLHHTLLNFSLLWKPRCTSDKTCSIQSTQYFCRLGEIARHGNNKHPSLHINEQLAEKVHRSRVESKMSVLGIVKVSKVPLLPWFGLITQDRKVKVLSQNLKRLVSNQVMNLRVVDLLVKWFGLASLLKTEK